MVGDELFSPSHIIDALTRVITQQKKAACHNGKQPLTVFSIHTVETLYGNFTTVPTGRLLG